MNEQQPDEVNTESESDDIKWETEISFEDAYKALEEKLYGFKKVRPVLYLCGVTKHIYWTLRKFF